MIISGMTGFARDSGNADWGNWVWEARSVNGRSLDLRINLPSGLDSVEQAVRKLASRTFDRGNIQISLRIELIGGNTVRINHDILKTLMQAYGQVQGDVATGPALAALMQIKGVVEAETPSMRDLGEMPGVVEALTLSAGVLVEALGLNRQQEGAALQSLLSAQLVVMEAAARDARAHAETQRSAIADKYRARIAEFDVEGVVSDERLATEIAVLAAKADVTEELDRLDAHIARGMTLLSGDGPIGRDLGFLAQELNREANTLCSKSAALDLTNAGLTLKSLIDQFKEQAANVE